jgi:hypothetical protein
LAPAGARTTFISDRLLADWSWDDFYAAADPFPDGPVLQPRTAEQQADPLWKKPPSTRIRNRDSVFADHSTYWQNAEQFVAPVAKSLVALAGKTFLPNDGDQVRLDEASARRERRVDALRWAGWLTFAAVPVAAWGLWPGYMADLTRWVAGVLEPVLGWLAELFDLSIFTDSELAPWIGVALVVAGAWVYRMAVVEPLWRRWDLRMADQLFARRWAGWQKSRMGWFSLAACVPPGAAVVAAAYARSSWPLGLLAVVVAACALYLVGVRPARADRAEPGGATPAATPSTDRAGETVMPAEA